ncbi:MAG: hypothetical protein JWN15_824 [Firmicutes bacterium]|nr:hypothetical protein [Bacillota bacterium]
MAEYHWVNVKSRHPDAYRAEGVDHEECRVEIIWTLHPGIKQQHRVVASLTYQGGSLWRVEKRFMRLNSATHFFWRMKGQAEDRLRKLNCAD